MKTPIVLIAFLAIASASDAFSQSNTTKKSPMLKLEQMQIKGSRKIVISPVQPTSGIDTGGVVAYGHVIPPPYRVEYSGDRLLVNGVQVEPSLVRERDVHEHPPKALPPEKQAIQQKAGELMIAARKIFEEGEEHVSIDVLHRNILDLLSKHPDVILNPTWRGTKTLCYTTPVYQSSQCEGFGPSIFSSPEVQARNTEKNKADEILQMEKELKAGGWICFGSTDRTGAARDPRDAVNRIMNDFSLAQEQKVELLKGIFHRYGTALDIVDNYVAAEWALTKAK